MLAASEGGSKDSSTAAKALALLARWSGLDPADLQDDANFASLGVDSLLKS